MDVVVVVGILCEVPEVLVDVQELTVALVDAGALAGSVLEAYLPPVGHV